MLHSMEVSGGTQSCSHGMWPADIKGQHYTRSLTVGEDGYLCHEHAVQFLNLHQIKTKMALFTRVAKALNKSFEGLYLYECTSSSFPLDSVCLSCYSLLIAYICVIFPCCFCRL